MKELPSKTFDFLQICSHLINKILNGNLNFFPARIYLLKVNNRNTRTRCEIRSKLAIKTPERHWVITCVN